MEIIRCNDKGNLKVLTMVLIQRTGKDRVSELHLNFISEFDTYLWTLFHQ